ncbi:hypothetical protein M2284_002135 [Rhodococcus sp. LBL1]|nr:hypothetical protein [Rhodococcus sp. LBL1]MDH6683523.1 hypothetical protein [Rhodococcus sp. LBL2]
MRIRPHRRQRFPVPGPLVVGECGGPTVAPPAVCHESPAVPAAVVTGGAAETTSRAGGTSLAGLGTPLGGGPMSPPRGSFVGGGSLDLDGLVVEGTVRAVGAIVGVVADVALAVVDTVGDLVREAAATAETVEEADAGCSLNLDREPCCDGAPAPRDPVPEECPTPDSPPAAPMPVAQPAADADCPEPAPEYETPSPAAEPPAMELPTEQPEPEPEPVELQPTELPVESCVPAVTPPAHPALGARPATGSRAAAEPALAELGSEPPAPDGAGAEIAEAGPL